MGKRSLLMLGGLVVALGFIFAFWFALPEKEQELVLPTVDDVVNQLLLDREARIDEDSELEFASKDVINVLVLGLDSRKSGNKPHCDAIHMFSLNIKEWTIHIISVPRGTYAYIPPGTYGETEYYLANACAFVGLDYGVQQIERVLGVKADYVVTAGFSQVIGILRSFDLPTTETLQWLRHRQSYAIGDPQRSHNQAVFMKDMIVGNLDRFRSKLRLPMTYALFSFVDTDMEFKMMRTLLEGYLSAKIDQRPEDITLEMRPYYPTVDYHFDTENAEAQIQALVDFMRPYLSKSDLSEVSLESIQEDLVSYLELRLESEDLIDDILGKQLWLQVDDDDDRERLHFEYFKRSIEDFSHQSSVDAISDYILEKEVFKEEESVKWGKELLAEYL